MPEWKTRNTQRARDLRNAATPAERMLWTHLSRSQLGAKFSRQMPVGPYYADFVCRSHRLVVELDGHSHEMQTEHDGLRDAFLHREGYRVMRFTNDEVLNDMEGVAIAIQVALKDRPTPDPSRKREGGS
jgi:BirA family biotin operon repressor/biotin-[acetyl-CoA-carboxylase] ligase